MRSKNFAFIIIFMYYILLDYNQIIYTHMYINLLLLVVKVGLINSLISCRLA